MQRAAAVVGVAERITERIAATRDVPRELLHTIHDGFDPARVEVGRREEGARSPDVRRDRTSDLDRAGVGADFAARYSADAKFVVQYAGNMGLSHPFEAILAAARALSGESGLLFQFIGDGPQRGRILTGLPPNAQLIGYQPAEHLGGVLAAADVCLISQHAGMFDQALPYKIYATLAAGKPCIFIGNRRNEIVEWLEQSNCGVHVDQDDADRLAAVIRELKGDPPRLQAMSAAARALFDARFHADRTAAQWAELLAGVIGG
jgi:glycosyltransferase involved in cell wall biosynthesis